MFWLYNASVSVTNASGNFLAQGALLKFARYYPALHVRICLGCISLGWVYYEVKLSDLALFVFNGLVNATVWCGGNPAAHLGEPAG